MNTRHNKNPPSTPVTPVPLVGNPNVSTHMPGLTSACGLLPPTAIASSMHAEPSDTITVLQANANTDLKAFNEHHLKCESVTVFCKSGSLYFACGVCSNKKPTKAIAAKYRLTNYIDSHLQSVHTKPLKMHFTCRHPVHFRCMILLLKVKKTPSFFLLLFKPMKWSVIYYIKERSNQYRAL
jgi:hypothetical protein